MIKLHAWHNREYFKPFKLGGKISRRSPKEEKSRKNEVGLWLAEAS